VPNPNELVYKKTGRLLIILFVLYIPVVGTIGFGIGKLLDSSLPLFLAAGAYMAVVLFFWIKRFIAYYRWKGQYPFHWLFK